MPDTDVRVGPLPGGRRTAYLVGGGIASLAAAVYLIRDGHFQGADICILEEADEISGETADNEVLDAALIASAQAVEHYEITRYGTLIAWAKELGREDCAQLLSETLAEEKNADKKLSSLAEGRINRKAA